MKPLASAIVAVALLIAGPAHATFELTHWDAAPATAGVATSFQLTVNYAATAAGPVAFDIIAPDDVALTGVVTPTGSTLSSACFIDDPGSSTTPWKTRCRVQGDLTGSQLLGSIRVAAFARNGGFTNGQPVVFTTIEGTLSGGVLTDPTPGPSHTLTLTTLTNLRIGVNGNIVPDEGATMMQIGGVWRAGKLVRYLVGVDEIDSARIEPGATIALDIKSPAVLASAPNWPAGWTQTGGPTPGASGTLALTIGPGFGVAGSLTSLTGPTFEFGTVVAGSFDLWLFLPCDDQSPSLAPTPPSLTLAKIVEGDVFGNSPRHLAAADLVSYPIDLGSGVDSCNVTRTSKVSGSSVAPAGGSLYWLVTGQVELPIIDASAADADDAVHFPAAAVVVDHIPTDKVVFTSATIGAGPATFFDLFVCADADGTWPGTFDVATFDALLVAGRCWPNNSAPPGEVITHVVARSKPGNWTNNLVLDGVTWSRIPTMDFRINATVRPEATGSFTNLACIQGTYDPSGAFGGTSDVPTGPDGTIGPCSRFTTTVTTKVYANFDLRALKATTNLPTSFSDPLDVPGNNACTTDAQCGAGRYCNDDAKCAESVIIRFGPRHTFYSGDGSNGAPLYFKASSDPTGIGRIKVIAPPGFMLIPSTLTTNGCLGGPTPAFDLVWGTNNSSVELRPQTEWHPTSCGTVVGSMNIEARPRPGALLREDTPYEATGELYLDTLPGDILTQGNEPFNPIARSSPVHVSNPGEIRLALAAEPCVGNTKRVVAHLENASGADADQVITTVQIADGLVLADAVDLSFTDLTGPTSVAPPSGTLVEYLFADNSAAAGPLVPGVVAVRITVPTLPSFVDMTALIELANRLGRDLPGDRAARGRRRPRDADGPRRRSTLPSDHHRPEGLRRERRRRGRRADDRRRVPPRCRHRHAGLDRRQRRRHLRRATGRRRHDLHPHRRRGLAAGRPRYLDRPERLALVAAHRHGPEW